MIGEMRDTETAQIAVQSALTGHRAIYTACNTAAGATRLGMGGALFDHRGGKRGAGAAPGPQIVQ